MDRISTMLLNIGITPDLKGFEYIKEGVVLIIAKKTGHLSVTKELYPDIAEIAGTTASRVERCIRYVKEKAISQDHGEIQKTIGISPYSTKLSNSQFMHCIAYKIKSENAQEE